MSVCQFALFALSLLFVASGCSSFDKKPEKKSYFVYVSVSGENKIAIYEMNPENGDLYATSDAVTLKGSPGSLAVDPERKFLYAAIRSNGTVLSFRIDPHTGNLMELGSAPVLGNPVYIATDRTGKYLLTAYYGAGKIAVYPIDDGGVVSGDPVIIQSTEKNPHSINVDPSNRYAFVPNTGADLILQYRFNSQSGVTLPNQPPSVATDSGDGPRHFYFHPHLSVVYFVNEKGSSVTAYNFDPEAGTLAAFQTISTLPKDFTEKNSCADIEVTPDGKFVYASNRGHDSLACYSIQPRTGQLTAIGQAATESTPREFNIDPTGKFIYSAGQSSGRLAVHRIDPMSGQLSRVAVYPVGEGPAWVLTVEMPAISPTPDQ